MKRVVTKIAAKTNYAWVLLKYGGPVVLFKHMVTQYFHSGDYVGFVKELEHEDVAVMSRVPYILSPATSDDVKEVMDAVRQQSRHEIPELLFRKNFFDVGFDCCYVARTKDTNEIAHWKWFVTSQYNTLIKDNSWLMVDRLEDDVVLTEYTYTFEKFRKSRIGAAVRFELAQLYRQRGYRRVIGYASKDNPASLRSFELDGYKRFEEVYELRLPFIRKRKRIALQ